MRKIDIKIEPKFINLHINKLYDNKLLFNRFDYYIKDIEKYQSIQSDILFIYLKMDPSSQIIDQIIDNIRKGNVERNIASLFKRNVEFFTSLYPDYIAGDLKQRLEELRIFLINCVQVGNLTISIEKVEEIYQTVVRNTSSHTDIYNLI